MRRALWLQASGFAAIALLLLAILAGCGKSPEERLIDRTVQHLEAALHLLEDAHGDDKKLLEGAMAYRARHARDIASLRHDFEALRESLDPSARTRLDTEAGHRWTPLLSRIEIQAQQFPQPAQALRYVRPLLLRPTPRGIPGTPWLPEAPPLPLEPGGSPTATAPGP